MKRMSPHTKHPKTLVLALAVLGLAGLSGCIGGADDGPGSTLGPQAVLSVDEREAWVGESFLFNATGSSYAGGNISRYHFDFGDGANVTVEAEEGATVEHDYDAGGVYTVTLTIFGEGNETEAPRDSTNTTVTVNERQVLQPRVLYANPLANATGNNTTERGTYGFNATETMVRYEADISVRSTIVAGTPEFVVRVLDAEGNVTEQTTGSVDAGQNVSVPLEGALTTTGDHVIEIVATSGGAAFDGVLRLYHEAEAEQH